MNKGILVVEIIGKIPNNFQKNIGNLGKQECELE
jgi:hypothetical protein